MEKWTIYLVIGIVTVGLVVGGLTMTKKESTQETISQSFTTLGDGSVEIVPVNTDGYAYATNNTEYSAYFKQYSNWGDGVKYCVDVNGVEKCLIYQPQDMSYRDVYGSQDYLGSISNSQAVLNGTTITYPEIFTNVDLSYILTNEQMNEYFIIKNKTREPASYLTPPITLDFGGYVKWDDGIEVWVNNQVYSGETLKTNGKVEFKFNGITIFTIPDGKIHDSNTENQLKQLGVEKEIQKKGKQIWFYKKIPYNMVNESTYPLYVDPTLLTSYDSCDVNAQYSTYVCSNAFDNSTSTFTWFYGDKYDQRLIKKLTSAKQVEFMQVYNDDASTVTWLVGGSNDSSCLTVDQTNYATMYTTLYDGFTTTTKNTWHDLNFTNANAYLCYGVFPYDASGWIKIKEWKIYESDSSPPASVNNWVDCTSNPVTNESKSYNSSFFVNGTGTWSIKHDIVLDKFNFTNTCNVDVYNVGSLTLT